MYICIYEYMYICIYVYMYMCMYVYMYRERDMHMSLSLSLRIYTYIHICVYMTYDILNVITRSHLGLTEMPCVPHALAASSRKQTKGP